MRPIVLLLLATLCAAEELNPWVRVEYYDPGEKDTLVLYGQLPAADLAALSGPSASPVVFLHLRKVWYWVYGPDDETIVGLESFADREDKDEVFLRTTTITAIVPLNGGPDELLKEHLKPREEAAAPSPANVPPTNM